MSTSENSTKNKVEKKEKILQSPKIDLVSIFNKKNFTIFLKLKNDSTIVLSPNGLVSKIQKSLIDYDSLPEGIEIFK